MTTLYSATQLIQAPPDSIWHVLTDPSRHDSIDASGTVGAPVTDAPLRRAGQVFTMRMSYHDGERVTHYRTDNHVTEFEPGRVIAWMTAVVGEPPLGWTWRYELVPVTGGTDVTLTYDWTGASAENIELYEVPNRSPEELHAALVRLARLVAG